MKNALNPPILRGIKSKKAIKLHLMEFSYKIVTPGKASGFGASINGLPLVTETFFMVILHVVPNGNGSSLSASLSNDESIVGPVYFSVSVILLSSMISPSIVIDDGN